MKILAIHMRNLASLEGNNEISFMKEPLRSAGIFAITGPTGAGKSTILDALCLALYAQTPRYRLAESGIAIEDIHGSAMKQGDARGILRDGTAEGYAKVDFLGRDGRPYQATWSVRRARNRPSGNLQLYDVQLHHLDTGEAVPGRKTELLQEIEALVGLNFEQFTRSVLLAQGDFTAFMKARKDEKASLLEKLTGTQVYTRISKQVFEQNREESQELQNLNIRKESVPTLEEEELEGLNKKRESFDNRRQELNKQITGCDQAIHWRKQLDELQAAVDTAQKEYKVALDQKEAAAEREAQLQKVEQVQEVRSKNDQWKEIQREILDKQAEEKQLSEKYIQLGQEKNILKKEVEEAEEHLKESEQRQSQASPHLNKARALDVQIEEKTKQLRLAQNGLLELKNNVKEERERLEKEKQLVRKLTIEYQQLTTWLEKYEPRRPVAEQDKLILAKLADGTRLLKEIKGQEQEIIAAQKEKQIFEKELKALEETQRETTNEIKTKKLVYHQLKEKWQAVSIDHLEEERGKQESKIAELVRAEAHWRLLYSGLREKRANKQQLKKDQDEAKEQQGRYLKITEELKEASLKRKTSAEMLDKAKLAAAESVGKLRQQLQEGEPCPVCGSPNHPYASDDPGTRHVLAQIEEEHLRYEQDYTNLLKEESRLQKSIEHLQAEVEKIKEDQGEKEEILQKQKLEWKGFSFYAVCEQQQEQERASWLNTKIKEQKLRQETLQTRIKEFNQLRRQLEQRKEGLEQLKKREAQSETERKEIFRKLQSLQERSMLYRSEKRKQATILQNLREEISVYLKTEEWYDRWRADPEGFIEKVKTFAAKWQDTLKREAELNKALQARTIGLNNLDKQLQSRQTEIEKEGDEYTRKEQEQNEIQEKRRHLFGGKAVEAVEKELGEAVRKAREVRERKLKEKGNKETSFTQIATQKEQTEQEIKRLTQKEITAKEKVNSWLTTFNEQQSSALTLGDLEPLLSFDTDWIKEEVLFIQEVRDRLSRAESVWKARKKTLETEAEKQISDKHLEALQEERQALQEELEHVAGEYHKISMRLRQDEENKEQIAGLLVRIEKQSEIKDQWSKLNDIIGSADGKKFRTIAQEYTLDVLLAYANVHLEVLNRRYILERIPDSLGLQVLDMDMGREIRTVYSLSGGESFLVSLALALGLASLSSSRMQVESLFIDEGFGSLDPETLDMAMDALERLYHQGRKVGVISHVQEMTERIPVQIKVKKFQNGKSKLQV